MLSEEAHRRVAQWLEERGLEAVPQTLELKGFDEPQPAFRLKTRLGKPSAAAPEFAPAKA